MILSHQPHDALPAISYGEPQPDATYGDKIARPEKLAKRLQQPTFLINKAFWSICLNLGRKPLAWYDSIIAASALEGYCDALHT
jgi:hypothetical protein